MEAQTSTWAISTITTHAGRRRTEMDSEDFHAMKAFVMFPSLVSVFCDESCRRICRDALEKIHASNAKPMFEILNKCAMETCLKEIVRSLEGAQAGRKLATKSSLALVHFVKLVSSLPVERIMGLDLQKQLFIGVVYGSLSLLKERRGSIEQLYRDSVDLVRNVFKNETIDTFTDMRTEFVKAIKQEVATRHLHSSVDVCQFFDSHNVLELQRSLVGSLNRLSSMLSPVDTILSGDKRQKETLVPVPDFFSDAEDVNHLLNTTIKAPWTPPTLPSGKSVKASEENVIVERFLLDDNVRGVNELPEIIEESGEDEEDTVSKRLKTGRFSAAEDRLIYEGLRARQLVCNCRTLFF